MKGMKQGETTRKKHGVLKHILPILKLSLTLTASQLQVNLWYWYIFTFLEP